jgi:hypothetical protein
MSFYGNAPICKFVKAILTISIILILYACASQKLVEKKPLPKFQGMTLATNVDDAGKIGVAKGLTSEFNSKDEQIVAFLTFENMSGTHNLRWEWVEPNGKVYFATKNYPLRVNNGKYLPKVTAWHQISLKDEPAAKIPGKWSAKIFVDDELIDSKPFNVKAVADSLALPKNLFSKPYPKDWGLIIGVEEYDNLPNVEYARKDAFAVRDYFTRILGVPEENIITLIDKEATKARIEGYVKNYIPSNLSKDSTLYVYFAGHGLPGTQKGEPYLVPYDADTRFIEQTGYKLISFYQDLHQANLEHVYVFLDSCFSGVASRTAELLVKGARPAMFHVEEVDPPARSIISLNATSTGQISNAFPEKEHGLFTYYLLQGLKGKADADDNGWISIKEVYEYVYRHVDRESRRLQSRQTPVIVPSANKLKDVAMSRAVIQ